MRKLKISSKRIKTVVVDLAGALEYQKNSIISHEIVNKKTGTVSLFAFDKGQGLSEHIAPFDAMVHVLDGQVQVNIAGKPHFVKKITFGDNHKRFSVVGKIFYTFPYHKKTRL